MWPSSAVKSRIKRFGIETGTKVLCIHLGYNFDSVQAGLSLPGFLLLEHTQTSHSLKSACCGKLPHPDAFTQAPTCVCAFSSHSFWTSSSLDVPAGVTQGGRPHRIFHPPSFCGACLNFSREKDSAIPFPRRP